MKAFAGLMVVCLAGMVGCAGHQSQPEHQPWVIYESGWGTRADCDAIGRYIMDRAEVGGTVGGGDGHLTVTLSGYRDATPRAELVRFVQEIEQKFPSGCPLTIEVETLDAAVEKEERSIHRSLERIAALKRIHGEGPASPVTEYAMNEEKRL